MKRKKIHFTIEYIVLALMVFTLALDRRLLPPLMLLLSFNWLVEVFGDVYHKLFLKSQKSMVAFPYKWNNLSKNRLILALGLYSGLFLLYAIGLLYSENMSHGRFDIVSKLSLLAMPVILFTSDSTFWNKSLVKWLFNLFILGCLIGIAYCMYHSYTLYQTDHAMQDFFYQKHSAFHHPSYASMYYIFALSIMLYNLLNQQYKLYEKIISFILIPLFILEVFLLSSKTAFLVMFFVAVLFIFYIIIHKHHRLLNLSVALILLLISISIFKFMPDKYNRFLLKFNHIHSFEDVKEDVRYTIWDTSWEAAKENLPFGVGSGDIKDVLKSKYSERSLPYFNKREYNTHNQYLQILLAVGIPGILLFVSGLFYTLYVSMQKRCFLYLVFMLIIAINLLTESMLERQSGVVFYAIFNAFLCLIAFIIPHSKLPAKS